MKESRGELKELTSKTVRKISEVSGFGFVVVFTGDFMFHGSFIVSLQS